MNNDYLRVTNPDVHTDDTVNKYSAKAQLKRKNRRDDVTTTLDLIIDEVYELQDGTTELIFKEPVKKPKILDAIFFSFIYLVVVFALMVTTKVVKDLFLVYLLAIISAFFIPISFLYFFYRLDIRGKIKFSSIIYCLGLGITVFLIVDFLFDFFVSKTLHFYIYMVAVRCVVELLTIVLLSVFTIENKVKHSKTTAILYACAISAGFAFAEALSNNFASMLISFKGYTFGSSIGGILNIESFIESSANNLIEVLATTSLLDPLMFIMLAMILVDVTVTDEWAIGKRTITSVFMFLFCCLTYILSRIKTVFSVLSLLYSAVAITFTIVLFIRMINVCISSEKYE